MARPVLLKLGGSILTDKQAERSFRRGVASRLCQEIAKAKVPTVVLHGAGSFGHPIVARSGIGTGSLDAGKAACVGETFAGLAELEGRLLTAASAAGLRPVPLPLHLGVRYDAQGNLSELPAGEITDLLADGWTPILHGTLVRHPRVGWQVLGADRLMAELAPMLQPRLALFASDVDGVYSADPKSNPAATLLPQVSRHLAGAGSSEGTGWDVTGRMEGKLAHALAVAEHCPTLIVNGLVRGRVLDALRGKPVTGTRITR
ncbi:MAG: isopentenyl phosphate kinase [bacterium]